MPDERQHPSLVVQQKKQHPRDALHSDLFSSNKVRCFLHCVECGKLRCVYAKLKLTAGQQKLVSDASQSQQYVCGAPLSEEVEADMPAEAEVVVVHCGLNCASPLEVVCFSCKLGIPQCCFQCGTEEYLLGEASEYLASLKRTFSVFKPHSKKYRNHGLEASTRHAVKSGSSAKRSKSNK